MKLSQIIKKYILLSSLFFLCYTSYSQHKIRLIDKATQEPIPFAHVYFQKSEKGVVSNSQGYFNLGTALFAKDSITIQHLSYTTTRISTGDLQNLNSIELSRKTTTLEGVEISNKTAQGIVMEALEYFDIIHLDKTTFQTYYREYVVRNNEYVMYADGLINYHTALNKKKSNLDLSSEIIQSRVYDFAEEEKFDVDIISPIDMKKLISYNNLSKIGKFLTLENHKDYAFEFDYNNPSNNDYYRIIINPKKGAEKILYNGSMLIMKSDMSIREIQFETDSTLKEYFKEIKILGLSMRFTNGKGFLQFAKNEKGSYLKYGKISISIHTETKKKLNQDNDFISEVMVNNMMQPTESKKYSTYKKKSLYKNGNQFDSDFWKSANSMTATSKESILIQKLIDKSKAISAE